MKGLIEAKKTEDGFYTDSEKGYTFEMTRPRKFDDIFDDAKLGERVFDLKYGWGTITKVKRSKSSSWMKCDYVTKLGVKFDFKDALGNDFEFRSGTAVELFGLYRTLFWDEVIVDHEGVIHNRKNDSSGTIHTEEKADPRAVFAGIMGVVIVVFLICLMLGRHHPIAGPIGWMAPVIAPMVILIGGLLCAGMYDD